MSEAVANIAQLFYEADIITMKKGLLEIDFFKGLAKPKVFDVLAGYAAAILDDYATDILVSKQDSLFWMPNCAAKIDLPSAWLREDTFLGLTKDIKRAIHCSLLSPTVEEVDSLLEKYKKQNIELVATFSLLGQPGKPTPIRQINLVSILDVLKVYQLLHLITESELKSLTKLHQEEIMV